MATEIEHVAARISHLSFILEFDAAWLAIRALLIATKTKANFLKLHTGLLEIRARDQYLKTGRRDALWPTPGSDPLLLEGAVRYAVKQCALGQDEMCQDVMRLGDVLRRIVIHGSSKGTAYADAQGFAQQEYKSVLDTKGIEVARNYLGRSPRSLQKLWALYEPVLAYVYLDYAQAQRLAARVPGFDHSHIVQFPYLFRDLLNMTTHTKPIKQKRMQVIVFK